MAEIETDTTPDTSKLLSKPWQKFLAKFTEIDVLQNSQWKEVHLLAYICKRYEECTGSKFALTYRGAPSRCVEIHMVKKIMAMLGTTNMRTIRAYIDWVYDVKIVPKKIKFRTLGFFTTPGFANEFSNFKIEKARVTKTTELPIEYRQVAEMFELEVATYGELAFIKMAAEETPDCESCAPYVKLLHHLSVIGLDLSILNSLV